MGAVHRLTNTVTLSEQVLQGSRAAATSFDNKEGEEVKHQWRRSRRRNKFKTDREVIEKRLEVIELEKTETDGPRVPVREASSQLLEGDITDTQMEKRFGLARNRQWRKRRS